MATHHFLSQSDLNDICVQVNRDYLPHNSLLVAVDEQDRAIGFMGMTGREIRVSFHLPNISGAWARARLYRGRRCPIVLSRSWGECTKQAGDCIL
jgi:hypothetical protein